MIKLNSNHTILPYEVSEPRIGFDADYYKLYIRNIDTRTDVDISYTLNNDSYTIKSGIINYYDVPAIDTLYTVKYIATPKAENMKGISKEFKIFKNNINCKYYRYAGDKYESTHIDKYTGTMSNVVIPTKHNMFNTLSAELLDFPNVKSSTIQVTTPYYMDTFNIRDDRITDFVIDSLHFKPIDYQFANFPNLKDIRANFVLSSNYMFANSPKLNMDPSNTKDMEEIGQYAFYNTPSQKVIRIKASTIEENMFDGDTEKVIFTKSEYVNGKGQKALADYKFKYSNGVHQLYSNVSDDIWVNEAPEENSLIEVVHYNSTGSDELYEGLRLPKESVVLSTTDTNIIGFKFETRRESGTIIGKGFCFPDERYREYRSFPSWVQEISGTKYFTIYWNKFYGDDENSSLSLIPFSTDVIYTTPIGRDGILKTTSKKTITGEIPVLFHLSETTAVTLNTDNTYTITAISDFEESITWSSTDSSIVSIEEITNTEVVLTAHKVGRVTISATIISGGKTYTRSFYVNVLTPIEILPDTETASQELLVAAAAVNVSSYTRYDIDAKNGMLMGSSLGANQKYWMLWIKKDLNKDIVGVLYDGDGNEVMFLDLAQYAGPTYTYSNSQAFNLGAFQDTLTTNHYLKCWYKNNPSFGCFRINLVNKSSYDGNEEPIYDELPSLD